jgi:hypothetical protein
MIHRQRGALCGCGLLANFQGGRLRETVNNDVVLKMLVSHMWLLALAALGPSS